MVNLHYNDYEPTEALEGHLLLIFDVLLFITYNLLLINYYLLLKF